jgi:NitT/TauT family transport system permease protein
MIRDSIDRLAPWLAGLSFVLVWWLVIVTFRIQSYILPTPWQTITAMYTFRGPLFTNGLTTLATTLIGFSIAVVVGMILGIIVGSSRFAYRALYPLLVAFNSVPKAALVPIFVIWFGAGAVPAVLTAFMLSFFPVVANVATAFATIEPELLEVMRSLGASQSDMTIKVGIPRSLPYFFASLKIAITLAFVGAVIAEIVAGNSGIGNVMLLAGSNFNVPLVFAALFIVGAMGVGMYAIFDFVERRMTGWSVRGANTMQNVGGG